MTASFLSAAHVVENNRHLLVVSQSTAEPEVVFAIVCTHYKTASLLHIEVLDSTGSFTPRHGQRTAIISLFKYLISHLSPLHLYIYSRPKKLIFTTRKGNTKMLSKNNLLLYWQNVLEELGYKASVIDHRAIREEKWRETDLGHLSSDTPFLPLRDDPLTRTFKKVYNRNYHKRKNDNVLNTLFSILVDSIDIKEGSIVTATRDREEKAESNITLVITEIPKHNTKGGEIKRICRAIRNGTCKEPLSFIPLPPLPPLPFPSSPKEPIISLGRLGAKKKKNHPPL